MNDFNADFERRSSLTLEAARIFNSEIAWMVSKGITPAQEVIGSLWDSCISRAEERLNEAAK